jgi:DNA-binding transcriptional MerR regulator
MPAGYVEPSAAASRSTRGGGVTSTLWGLTLTRREAVRFRGMKQGRTYQVKEVSRMTGVSVRALHHYDEIGLLVPSGRTEAGYRLYDQDDLLRLQQILILRELGLALEEIKRSLDDPSFDRRAALEKQRREIAARAERLQAMLGAVDAALAALTNEGEKTMKEMTQEEITTLFDGFDPSRYEDEVEARWGKTDAYRESARRTSQYTKQDWERYKAEAHAIMSDAAELFRRGLSPDAAEATAVAERHRLSIDRWFYPCDRKKHAGLADMYEADARFAASIDAYAPGLTAWWSAAIRANAR